MRHTTSTKGILRPGEAARHVDLRRWPATGEVERYVERYWAVHRDLRGRRPYRVDLIPHPCVNLTFGPGPRAELHGVGTRTSAHPLAGAGWVFGVKFRPGGFAALTGAPASTLTDRSLPAGELLGPAVDDLTRVVCAAGDDQERVRLVGDFLRRRLPRPDPAYELLITIVADLLHDRALTRVDRVAQRHRVSVRTLQRLFRRYVGVGPKWVIRRYRMHDSAELLASGTVTDPATLAVELGWFDQAHFTRDFTALIGTSPLEYAAVCAAARDREPAAVVRSG